MAPVSAINDLVAVRRVRSADSLGEVPFTLTDWEPGRVRLTPIDRTRYMAKRGREQQGGESVILIVRMCATLLDAGTTAIFLRVRNGSLSAAPQPDHGASANHHEGFPMSIPGTAREAVEASRDKAQDLHASDRLRPQGIRPRDRRVTASLASSLTP